MAGVSVDRPPDPKFTKWIGTHYRIGYRTTAYTSLATQSETFDTLYYLTRALLEPPETRVGHMVCELLGFSQNYLHKKEVYPLQNYGEIRDVANPNELYEAWNRLGSEQFKEYMTPFALMLKTEKGSGQLAQFIRQTVLDLSLELRMAA